ncbi:protein SAAL1 [Caerostris darwini]|uniref:Protein SAAL1 n=1 Tax=Caerostris darwini TaxID=1538125 RepID=A0AAV4T2Y7_9ARAC|nr:protein SAAL1 [Caerostris darwini]
MAEKDLNSSPYCNPPLPSELSYNPECLPGKSGNTDWTSPSPYRSPSLPPYYSNDAEFLSAKVEQSPFRNPSPPPEILDNPDFWPDRIGDTMYSKKDTYEILMDIWKWCDVTLEYKSTFMKADATDNSEDDIIELDPKLEDRACFLLEMSAEKEVAEFLNEINVPNIFLNIIDKTKSPRLLELIIGMLANMAIFDGVCQSISENRTLLNYVVSLSGTSDTPTLLNVFRLILCGLSNQNTQKLWFDAFEENPSFMENLKFIFKNCLVHIVIHGAFQLLDRILNENLNYCILWGESSYMKAIISAGKQLMKGEEKENLDNFFCVLNSICQYTLNVEELAKNWMKLKPLFSAYFLTFIDEDLIGEQLPIRKRLTSTICSFDTYNTLLNCKNIKIEHALMDKKILDIMYKIAASVNSLISDVKKQNMEILSVDCSENNANMDTVDVENSQNEPPHKFLRWINEINGTQYVTMMTHEEYSRWIVLKETVMDTAKTLLLYAEKDSEKAILENILNSEDIKENICILII